MSEHSSNPPLGVAARAARLVALAVIVGTTFIGQPHASLSGHGLVILISLIVAAITQVVITLQAAGRWALPFIVAGAASCSVLAGFDLSARGHDHRRFGWSNQGGEDGSSGSRWLPAECQPRRQGPHAAAASYPRCTLYFADGEHRWLSLEVDVTIVEGPDAPARLLRYFRVRDGKPSGPLDYHSDRSHYVGLGDDAFLKVMADENAVLYSFTITKTYGNR